MTARDLTAAVVTEITSDVMRPVRFFEGEFASGTVNLWTGPHDIVWDGKTWIAAGGLIGVSGISEASDLVANALTVALNGVDPTNVALVLTEARQFLPGRIWVGFLDEDGAVIADPYLVFSGKLDVPQIQDSADAATVSVTYENILADMNRPREYRYTDKSQQLLYPGDKSMSHVAALQEQELTWGR